MNLFALLELQKQFELDPQALEQAYFDAQKKTHPDQFAQSSPEEKQKAMAFSTKINQAYLTLKDPLKRAEYLLLDAGFEPLSHDPHILAEMMEWRERQESGEDISNSLSKEETQLMKTLHEAFEEKKYPLIQSIIYNLKYIQKMLKENK
jgi:molecular chaperone HscB